MQKKPSLLEICKIVGGNIEVKSVKYSKGHDADSMTCTLLLDGVKVAEVWDDSWGGGYQYDIKNQTAFDKIEASIPLFPKYEYNGLLLDQCLDGLVQDLTLIFMDDKYARKDAKKHIVARVIGKDYNEGAYLLWRGVTYSTEYAKQIRAMKPDVDYYFFNEFDTWAGFESA